MAEFLIPLSSGAQSFTIALGKVQYKLTLIYRDAEDGGWFLDIERQDTNDGLFGIPLVLGADLLEQHAYKRFGHLRCELDGQSKRNPTYEDMGSVLSLMWSE